MILILCALRVINFLVFDTLLKNTWNQFRKIKVSSSLFKTQKLKIIKNKKMSSRSKALQDFNAKLAAVKSENPQQHKSSFPDFDGMARQQQQEIEQRRQQAEAAGRAAVERSHVPKTASELRGPGAVQLKHKTKNEATDSTQLSVPINPDKKPYYLERIADGKRVGKKTSDVCLAETDSVVTGRGSLFAASNSKTFKGWKPGCF